MSDTISYAPSSTVDVPVNLFADRVELGPASIEWRGLADTLPLTVIDATWTGGHLDVYLYRVKGEEGPELGLVTNDGPEDVSTLIPAGATLETRICTLVGPSSDPLNLTVHRLVIADESTKPQPVADPPADPPEEDPS